MHLHAIVVGVGQVSEISSVVAKILEEPALAPFRVDFAGELEELLVLLLEGWRAR